MIHFKVTLFTDELLAGPVSVNELNQKNEATRRFSRSYERTELHKCGQNIEQLSVLLEFFGISDVMLRFEKTKHKRGAKTT